MKFSHEKLKVYEKALQMMGVFENYINSWQVRFDFINHLDRAAESVVVNLVEATRLPSSDQKLRYIDFSYGSCLECAACIDIANSATYKLSTQLDIGVAKKYLQRNFADEVKPSLLELSRMTAREQFRWNSSKQSSKSGFY